MRNYKLITLLTLLVFSTSCLEDKKETPIKNTNTVQYNEKTKDPTSYWIMDGNIKSDTIIIMNGGGPKWQLDIIKKGKTMYRYIPRYSEYGFAYMHQAQTINSEIKNKTSMMTLKESKEEVDKNTEMLHQAITYFKNQDKYVVVHGKSHGAYVVQEYLASKKPQADKYFLIAGRLAMNKEMTQQQLKGFNGEFSDDGLTYLPEDEHSDLSEYSEQEIMRYKNKQMLKAGYGTNNYIEKLKDVNMYNVTYLYGTKDKNIGTLTEKEISFLKSKNVRLLNEATDHSGMTRFYIDKLRDGTIKY